jgi:hypothetical protein
MPMPTINPFDVLRQSWYFFSHNLRSIVLLCLPPLLIEGLVRQQLASSALELAPEARELLVTLIFYPIYSAMLILFMEAKTNAQSVSFNHLLKNALRLWPRFSVLTGLTTLLIMLGSSLLILPGLWIMLRMIYAEYLLTCLELPAISAMRQSFRLSRGFFWGIALCVLLVMPPLWLLDWWSYQQLGDHPDAIAEILQGAGNGFLQLFVSVVGYRLYLMRMYESPPPQRPD